MKTKENNWNLHSEELHGLSPPKMGRTKNSYRGIIVHYVI